MWRPYTFFYDRLTTTRLVEQDDGGEAFQAARLRGDVVQTQLDADVPGGARGAILGDG